MPSRNDSKNVKIIAKCRSWGNLEKVLKTLPEKYKAQAMICVDSGGHEQSPSILKIGEYGELYLFSEYITDDKSGRII